MKRSLFLISVVSLGVIFGSCGNRKKSEQIDKPIVEEVGSNGNFVEDTVYSKSAGSPKDTLILKKGRKGTKMKEAPIHQAPDQEKIDSIKAAKAKEKNKL